MGELTAFCTQCNCRAPLITCTRYDHRVVRGVNFSYLEKYAVCKNCGAEIYIADLNDHNSKSRKDAYAKALILHNGINIKTLNPNSKEAIVIEFSTDKLTLHEASCISQYIREVFPDNRVIAIPDADLHSCGKDVLENYISMISEVIDQL